MDIHQSIKDRGILSDVVASTLLDIYTKCGSIPNAMHCLKESLKKMWYQGLPNGLLDVVASALVDIYTKYGSIRNAHELFEGMPETTKLPKQTRAIF